MATYCGDPVMEVLRRVDARGSGLGSLSVPGASLLLQKAGGLLASEVALLLAESRLDPTGRISFEDLMALLGAPLPAAGSAPPAAGKVARAELLEPDIPSEAAAGTEFEESLAEPDEELDQEFSAARYIQAAYRRHRVREQLRRESAAAACVRSMHRGEWVRTITGQAEDASQAGPVVSGSSGRFAGAADGVAEEEEMFETLASVAETQGLQCHATDREDLDSDADRQTIQTQLPLRKSQSQHSKQPVEWELSKQPRESELSKPLTQSELSKQPSRESELSKQPRASDLSSLRRGSTRSEMWDGSLAMSEDEVVEALAKVAATQGLSWRATDTG